jgi:hypothetical protein
MVLLAEQERLYADELQLVNDAGPYTMSGTQNWYGLKTYTVTLSKQLILYITAGWSVPGGTYGAFCLAIDGYTVWASGGISGSASGNIPDMYIMLPSGSHTITFYGAIWNGSGGLSLSNIYIGQVNFNDKVGPGIAYSGSVSVPAATQTTVLNQNVTVPTRALPIGSLANYSAFIFVCAYDVSGSPTRQTHLKNPGESNDAGKINVQLFINGSQVSWTGRANDDADGSSSNPSYGVRACGYLWTTVAANQTLNVQVQAYDSAGATVYAVAAILLCPWITPAQNYSPVSLSFSQGSTFYAWLEPLHNNTSQFASKIGKQRFYSFGDSTDYYSVLAGTGILQHTYMFDVCDVASSVWLIVSTTIVCVSYVGADIR